MIQKRHLTFQEKQNQRPNSTTSWNSHQDQIIQSIAWNTKMSRCYKIWLNETSWKRVSWGPLKLNHWKTRKKLQNQFLNLMDFQHLHNWQFFGHIWYKSLLRKVGQDGRKVFHHSLSTNRYLLYQPPHKTDRPYRKYYRHQHHLEQYFLPILQTLSKTPYDESSLGRPTHANKGIRGFLRSFCSISSEAWIALSTARFSKKKFAPAGFLAILDLL